MTVSSPTLAEQLAATRGAVDDLTQAVENLTAVSRRNRFWNIVLGVVVAAMVPLVLGGAVLTFFFIHESRNTDAEFRRVSQDLFLLSCEGTNANKELLRQDNIADGELLIAIATQVGSNINSAAVDAYRQGIIDQNEKIQDRDCQAELEQTQEAS